mgnify:CR=1 FL=1
MKPSSDAPTAPASLHTSARLGLTDKLKASLEQSLDDLDKPDKLGACTWTLVIGAPLLLLKQGDRLLMQGEPRCIFACLAGTRTAASCY